MTTREESCIDGALFWLHDAAATLTGEERRGLGETMHQLVDLRGPGYDVKAQRAAWIKEEIITLAEGHY